MIKVIDFVLLDTLGLKTFSRVQQRLLSHLVDAKAYLCLHSAYVVYYYHVHIVHIIRNGAMLIVERMKREIHDHFA